LSWYEVHADDSLRLLQAAGLPLAAAIIAGGSGASTLLDDLLSLVCQRITVLDLAGAAWAVSRERLGARANILTATLPGHAHDDWHDRAAFHFLTSPADQQAYLCPGRAAGAQAWWHWAPDNLCRRWPHHLRWLACGALQP
jgi:hypothetical protein